MAFRTGVVGAFATHLLVAGFAFAEGRETRVEDEVRNYLLPVVKHLKTYYIDEVPPDSLMRAGVDGLFRALDPGSDFTWSGEGGSWPENFTRLERIVHHLDRKAFYSVGADTLVRFGIAGMMSMLDPDTVFMEKMNLDNFRIDVQGEYGGLGFRIQVIRPDSAIAIASLLHEKTPAALAGVRSGDIIIAIDDSATTHMSASDAASLMRGMADTPVTLTLLRAGVDEPLEITITRKKVHIDGVSYSTMFPDSTGYIRLLKFQHNSASEVDSALAGLIDQGMKRLILDLRSNSGGFLHEAVRVADLFLPKDQLVVYTAGRAFEDTAKYFTRKVPRFGEGPLLLMVDRGSASASEIVSGAMQDWDRGLVLGQPTVGKGSVQKTTPIGENAELKLTVAAYFIPSGRSIDKRMRKDSTLVALSDQEFRTRRRGRIVHGAGGITPDIPAAGRKRTSLFAQLEGYWTADSKFFRFAREYPVNHPELTREFVAEDPVLEEFREYLEEGEFSYVSDLESRLLQLEEAVEEEGEQERLEKPLGRLKKEIDNIEEKHWKADAELIKWKLTFDILEKAFGMKGAYAYDVAVDPQVRMAREIIADPERYGSYFRRVEVGLADEEAIAAAPDSSGLEARLGVDLGVLEDPVSEF